jgi:hypothetical protein
VPEIPARKAETLEEVFRVCEVQPLKGEEFSRVDIGIVGAKL